MNKSFRFYLDKQYMGCIFLDVRKEGTPKYNGKVGQLESWLSYNDKPTNSFLYEVRTGKKRIVDVDTLKSHV